MCGRYATTRSAADLSALFEAFDVETAGGAGETAGGAGETAGGAGELVPRYNVAPTDPVPIVRISRRSGVRVLAVARWGLLPHWARDQRQAARMINARAETVATAPAFAPSFRSRRALVPADGWYEWRRLAGGGKQPYFITPADGSVLALAGLWSRWGPDGLLTFSVVTTAAAGELTTVHDRMPLVLPPQRWPQWLAGNPSLDPPPPSVLDALELRPVGPAVGNVRNDRPELIERIDVERLPEGDSPTLF